MSNPIYLSPSLASKLTGISERSIRRAIKKKELPVTIKKSRYQINFYDLLLWSDKLPNRVRKRDELGLGQFVEKWKI
ncbi:hypothetical protein CO134_02265 [Candidatus Kuenenbacteria bacterium CG_4_9_14_3_um_filter_39_14]|nr:MAG: hypothetical protein COZ84_01480 [Candidatus Kuenenbacteria bacterium CG_4_8_14_3_um_filter_39_15]PJA92030.1 MAG: hypothetical protein CO134_02265 [Candidatus Kuenenbacteria bacterium CG_4_9_14_3_um_filter_39_14]